LPQCLEILRGVSGGFSVVGLPQEWDVVKGGAKAVQRVAGLQRWGEFTGVYRVESAVGSPRHFFVAEPPEDDPGG
jgi:hypothetical protein